MSNMRTIRVTGRGQMKVHPDMTRIIITLEGRHKEYGETLRRSSEDTEQLRDLMSAFGFERSDLKTLNFGVDTEYETYKEKGEYKQRFVGYKFRHLLKLEFESDNKRLGKILYALAECPLNPEFRIAYTVNTLKDIQSIDYSWGEINFEVSPMRGDMMMEKRMAPMAAMDSYDMDIEPDDIDVSDTVTVVWEIG